ncbi:unnamed protein product [Dibothriocephalus latus]|uniref:Uncharacterized protein n=1 Tax=Dibothriocephalus latus TaxID=60516 RepID=A0A3P7PGP7_DIBLA|nr:unnamed protein product [Dibothriocephalus latus]
MSPNSLLATSTATAKPTLLARICAKLARLFAILSAFKSKLETRMDRLLELNFLLDPLVARFPKLRLLAKGKPKGARNTDRVRLAEPKAAATLPS